MFEPGILLSLATILIGGVAWAVRVEGRVNTHERMFLDREKSGMMMYTEIQQRLTRIEAKVDKLQDSYRQ